jgi:hypothetical protein
MCNEEMRERMSQQKVVTFIFFAEYFLGSVCVETACVLLFWQLVNLFREFFRK